MRPLKQTGANLCVSRWYRIACSRECLQCTLSVIICYLRPLKVCLFVYFEELKLSPVQVDSPTSFCQRDK